MKPIKLDFYDDNSLKVIDAELIAKTLVFCPNKTIKSIGDLI